MDFVFGKFHYNPFSYLSSILLRRTNTNAHTCRKTLIHTEMKPHQTEMQKTLFTGQKNTWMIHRFVLMLFLSPTCLQNSIQNVLLARLVTVFTGRYANTGNQVEVCHSFLQTERILTGTLKQKQATQNKRKFKKSLRSHLVKRKTKQLTEKPS